MENIENTQQNGGRRRCKMLPPEARQAILLMYHSDELSHLSKSKRAKFLAEKFGCVRSTLESIVK